MKKLLTLVTIAALVFSNATFGYAADLETITITIAISHTMNLEVGGSANLTINPGDTDVGGSITVKNIGTGIEETITLTNVTTLPTGWALQFQFTDADTAPAVGDVNWKNSDLIQEAIAYDVTKYLWIKLGVPNPTDLVTQGISVTINAG